MVAVPFEVLVSVSGLSIYFCLQASIIVWCDQSVQKWYGPIIPGVFNCKFVKLTNTSNGTATMPYRTSTV